MSTFKPKAEHALGTPSSERRLADGRCPAWMPTTDRWGIGATHGFICWFLAWSWTQANTAMAGRAIWAALLCAPASPTFRMDCDAVWSRYAEALARAVETSVELHARYSAPVPAETRRSAQSGGWCVDTAAAASARYRKPTRRPALTGRSTW